MMMQDVKVMPMKYGRKEITSVFLLFLVLNHEVTGTQRGEANVLEVDADGKLRERNGNKMSQTSMEKIIDVKHLEKARDEAQMEQMQAVMNRATARREVSRGSLVATKPFGALATLVKDQTSFGSLLIEQGATEATRHHQFEEFEVVRRGPSTKFFDCPEGHRCLWRSHGNVGIGSVEGMTDMLEEKRGTTTQITFKTMPGLSSPTSYIYIPGALSSVCGHDVILHEDPKDNEVTSEDVSMKLTPGASQLTDKTPVGTLEINLTHEGTSAEETLFDAMGDKLLSTHSELLEMVRSCSSGAVCDDFQLPASAKIVRVDSAIMTQFLLTLQLPATVCNNSASLVETSGWLQLDIMRQQVRIFNRPGQNRRMHVDATGAIELERLERTMVAKVPTRRRRNPFQEAKEAKVKGKKSLVVAKWAMAAGPKGWVVGGAIIAVTWLLR